MNYNEIKESLDKIDYLETKNLIELERVHNLNNKLHDIKEIIDQLDE